MFGFYDRGTNDIRIFFVDNNRTKETLLPIIKKNVYTIILTLMMKYTLQEFSLTVSRLIK